MRRTQQQLVEELTAQGLRFRRFAIEHDSPHCADDWDWNQRDLPHVPLIHGGFRYVLGAASETHAQGLYLQRVFGLRVPMTVAYHHTEGATRVYTATLGPFALIIQGTLTALASGGCRVRTDYAVGALAPATWLSPLIERTLRRNYARITAEDEPMRARRATLRAWGYRFATDGHSSYAGSLGLARDGVLPPALPPAHYAAPMPAEGETVLLGRADHRGAKLVREGVALAVYPRLCAHAGASLDDCPVLEGALRCPWHGRRVEPLVQLELGAQARGKVSNKGVTLRWRPGRVELDVGDPPE